MFSAKLNRIDENNYILSINLKPHLKNGEIDEKLDLISGDKVILSIPVYAKISN